ncbi:MAG: hypothetical protein HC897_20255 [Thermoanaerobaculia bacterium]|nr:hypothetical protein [Thermoanaerobaculia bacterium]
MWIAVLAAMLAAPPLPAQTPPADDKLLEVTPCERKIQELQRRFEKAPPPVSHGFPARPEIEYENSLITFRICEVKKGLTKEQELARQKSWKCCDPEFYNVQLVKLDAYMRLCREEPIINELGFREMRFTIEKWELFGRAELFGGDLVFSVTPGVVQPKSLVFSTHSGIPSKCQGRAGGLSGNADCEDYKGPKVSERVSRKDYPALIIYNAIYDVWLNGLKIVSAEPGIAMARGVTEIPPTGITVAFQKPVETTKPDGTIIKICPGTCSGMRTIPIHEFQAGLETAAKIKRNERLPEGWKPRAITTPAPRPGSKSSP